jgi:hypothetical protein
MNDKSYRKEKEEQIGQCGGYVLLRKEVSDQESANRQQERIDKKFF